MTMRKLLLVVWCLLPAGALAYHYGPGQDALRVDRAADLVRTAAAAADRACAVAAESGDDAARPHWAETEKAYGEALELLPAGRLHEIRSARLERAKARMFLRELPASRSELESLVEEIASDPGESAALLAGARNALANARYYMTWLLRLEGATREEWEPEIEGARQTYKLLCEESAAAGDEAGAKEARENLEATIRLARLDLSELQGLPLPSQ